MRVDAQAEVVAQPEVGGQRAQILQQPRDRSAITTIYFLLAAGECSRWHRVVPNFVIQGGGFTPDNMRKQTNPPIKNEADNGLKNLCYTVAMARTQDPHSASAQFFINVVDNVMLDFRGPAPNEIGYTVFGRVVSGLEVLDAIERVPVDGEAPRTRIELARVRVERIK